MSLHWNHTSESPSRYRSSIIAPLSAAFRRDLTNIAVGLDTRFDDPPDLMRALFELLFSSYQTGHRKTK